MPAPDRPPTPEEFRGQPARNWITAFIRWAGRDRILVDGGSGLEVHRTPGGRLLRVLGVFGILVVKSSGTITARSGSSVGTGSAIVQKFDGTSLTDTSQTVTVKNLIPTSVATGKYGLAFRVGGYYFGIFEC